MDKREEAKQKYVNAATLSSKSLAEGDHRTANKQAKILNRVMTEIEDGTIDKNILVDLLSHEYVGVSALAAIDLLRLGHEIRLAEAKLEQIASIDDSDRRVDERLTVMACQRQLEMWRTQGYVT